MNAVSPSALSSKQTPPASTEAGFNLRESLWYWLSCFRSVQLAIILISLLALATLAGVLLPQEGLVELSDIKRQYGPNFRILKAMGFFNVYSSSWFLTLQGLFFFNLLVGSFKWLKPAYLAATQKTFLNASQVERFQNRWQSNGSVDTILDWLKKHRYAIYQNPEKQDQWYATKGNLTRFGPHIAHIGILLLIIASVYGTFTGFKAQEMANPGSTFSFGQTDFFKPNIQENLWLGKTPDWKVKVNDFRVHYYPNDPKTVQQYYADLSLLSPDGKELKRQTISVNHPLDYGDVTIYQASFNPTGKLFVEVNGKRQTLKVDTAFEDRKVSTVNLGNGNMLIVFPFIVQQDPEADANKVVVFLKTPNGFLGAAPGKMPDNLRLRENQEGQIGSVKVKFLHPEFATGLQIKKAPEVPAMYLSYLIIAVGTILCIFSQRQIWLALDTTVDKTGSKTTVHFAFKTNKGKLSFLKELATLQKTLLQQNGALSVNNQQQ